MRIAVIGIGRAGSAIAAGLSHSGNEIKFGHRDPNEPMGEAAKWGEVIVMAIPFSEVKNVVKEIGSAADGKILIDATNPISPEMTLVVGFSTSAAEEIQKMLPKARVVKALNTVFSRNQSTGRIEDTRLTAFVASNDQVAKETVMRLTEGIGFDPVDCGPLRAARYLEPMAMLMMDLAFGQKMGNGIGYKLIKG
jgi:predicted dinucleotide-binding enzyme